MTQMNDPAGSNAPGFGAFIGSDGKDKTSSPRAPRGSRSTEDSPAAPKKASAPKKAGARRGSRKKAAPRNEDQEGRDSDAPRSARAKAAPPSAPSADSAEGSSESEAPKRRTRTRKTAGRSRSRSRSDEGQSEEPRNREDSRNSGESDGQSADSTNSNAEAPERKPRRRRGASEEEGGNEPRARAPRKGRRRAARSEDSDGEEAPAAERTSEGAADSESSTGEAPRRRRSRGGRRNARSSEESPKEGSVEETAQRSDSDSQGDSEGQSDSDGEGPARRTKSRRRSRGGRGRSKSRTEETERSAESSDEPNADDESNESGGKRRRRGSRGGRGKTKKVVGHRDKPGAAVVEFIPGEEDDLPALPELPDEAELINSSDVGSESGSKRKRGRRSRGDSDESLEPKTSRKKVEVVPDRKILVNACDSEETRVAVVRDGKILDFQMNVESDTSLVNDIYRGRIVNIEASIGAAFVDFGRGRNGFLHTSDVLPTYADKGVSLSQLLSTSVDPEDWDENSSQPAVGAALAGDLDGEEGESAGDDEDAPKGKGSKKKGRRSSKKAKAQPAKARQSRFRSRPRRPISELFKVGQKVVVQITKDAIGDKGPTLTTYLSIPGRYLVLMPSISHRGVSRKIEDSKERKRLKRILDGMTVPDGMGVIARTATQGHTKAEIKRDLDYLLSAWKKLAKGLEHGHGPAPLYQESDAAIRTVRDLFGPETESVIVDDPEAFQNIREFAELLMPEQADRIVEHDGKRPLFHAEGVEQDFEKIFSRRIELPSGGSIVFDQAEALVAIDVNSGKTRTSSHDFEEIAHKTNMEAVPEIARQIRLRDLGGIIVCDFIDMMKNSNRRAVETTFRAQFAGDRARSKMGRISQFGLLEMTRQRLGPGMSKKLFKPCTSCRGAGRERTESSKAAAILRRLGSALTLKGFSKIEVRAHPETIEFLKTVRKGEIEALQESSGRTLEMVSVPDQTEDSVLRYLRADGREVRPGGRRKR
jgi:ribonuclease E